MKDLTAEERVALRELARDIRRSHQRAPDTTFLQHVDALAVLDRLLAAQETP